MKNNAFITLTMLALLSLTTKAATLSGNLTQCVKIQDSLARLVCFDDLAEQALLPVNVVVKEDKNVSEIKAKTIMAPTSTKAADFGVKHLKKPQIAKEDLQIVFTVKRLSEDQQGKLFFTFENGQQWKQTDNDYLKVKVGESVLLKKGFMSAVYLKKNLPNSNRKIRVKRLK